MKVCCRPYEPGKEARTLFKYLVSRTSRRDECAGGAQNSVKKGTYVGPLNEGERACKTQAAHLALTLVGVLSVVNISRRRKLRGSSTKKKYETM